MMTLANYGLKSSKHKDPNSAKSLSKSLQIRNRAELALKQCLRTHFRLPDEKRTDIISSLEEYYSRVPFNVVIWNKFQAKQCIVDSILLLDSAFNPYRARQAFKAVEDMLLNLIYLPWHREFTRISTFSGRFRYIVSNPLIGVEEVFKAAGFALAPEGSIIDLVLPEDMFPQNDELQSVASVIFDCMLAQVILTDVISVFESCCKTLKQSASELTDDNINCYSWIQAYFRERSHQVTDKARSSIQELLNNILNHLGKQKITAARNPSSSNSKNERPLGPTEAQSLMKRDFIENSDKIAAQQQQIRRYLTQTVEDGSTIKIADDLLKLPSTNEPVVHRKQYATTLSSEELKPASGFNHLPVNMRNHQPALWRESNNSHADPYNRQHPVSAARQASRISDTFDMIDGYIRTDSQRSTSHDSVNQAVRVDVPHNDREPLIPRPDRRLPTHEGVPGSRCSPHQFYRTQMGSYPDGISQHALNSNSKYSYNDHPMSSYGTQASSQELQGMIKDSSSRYDGSSNRKYESRDMDRLTFNSRLQWSCDSCTYNNHSISEICEMCGRRRP